MTDTSSRESLFASPPTPECLSDLALDRIVAARGTPQTTGAHLASCGRCRARLELLEDSSHRASATTERMLQAALVSARSAPRPAPQLWRWFRPPRLAAAAIAVTGVVALLLVLPWSRKGPSTTPAGDSSEEIRIKGTALRFYVWRGGKVMPGVSGQVFRAGDALRFVVSTGSPSFFFLVGVDASGKVSAYHPFGGRASTSIGPAADLALPGSLVLDEARGTEFFIGLFSAEPLSLGRVEQAVKRALGRQRQASAEPPQLPLPGSHHWVVIRKE